MPNYENRDQHLSFRAGDVLTLDEEYLRETGAVNQVWLVIKVERGCFYFIDLLGYITNIQQSSAFRWHPAWRVIKGKPND